MRRSLPILGLSFALAFSAAAQARPNIEDVRALAFEKGIESIDEIELDDGLWKVEGRDANGSKIEMKVDAATGEIVKMERD